MERHFLKKTLLTIATVFVVLSGVLCIHICMVTRPGKADAHTVAMARVDLRQPITAENATGITKWLYGQPGVDHVLCNPKTSIVVFTYYPLHTDANGVIAKLKSVFSLERATRFVPTKEQMEGGCPIAATSLTFKAYQFIKHIL